MEGTESTVRPSADKERRELRELLLKRLEGGIDSAERVALIQALVALTLVSYEQRPPPSA